MEMEKEREPGESKASRRERRKNGTTAGGDAGEAAEVSTR
jgi:hypothetical protein